MSRDVENKLTDGIAVSYLETHKYIHHLNLSKIFNGYIGNFGGSAVITNLVTTSVS